MVIKSWWLIVVGCCMISLSHAANTGIITDIDSNEIVSFDPTNTSTPAIPLATLSKCDGVAISPNGQTVYVTSNVLAGDVFSFPINGPYTLTPLLTNIPFPVGIAISSDSLTGVVATDSGTPGLYSFPTGGSPPHTATLLTPTAATILRPLFIVFDGATAYVGDMNQQEIYSVTFSGSTYSATLIQSGINVSGLAVSGDGYLYISSNTGTLYRVPLASPADVPTILSSGDLTYADGIALSNDNNTLFISVVGRDIFSIPTNLGFPQTPTLLSALALPNGGIDIAIAPLSPPTNLSGSQLNNDFGLLYEFFNALSWEAGPSSTTVGYFVYRNAVKIATLDASALSYQDHNRPPGVTTNYSVTTFDADGNESFPISTSIN